jgi:1,4-dihydroxy-2-naphthoate octaprenyltransferase
VGFLAVAILVVNNLRDLETDRKAGKRTLVARHGRRFGEIQYLLLLGGAFAVPVVLCATGKLPPTALLCVLAFPLAAGLARRVLRQPDGEGWQKALAGTAFLSMSFGVLLAAGILL